MISRREEWRSRLAAGLVPGGDEPRPYINFVFALGMVAPAAGGLNPTATFISDPRWRRRGGSCTRPLPTHSTYAESSPKRTGFGLMQLQIQHVVQFIQLVHQQAHRLVADHA